MALLTTKQIEKLRDTATQAIEDIGSDISIKTLIGTTYDIGSGTTVPNYVSDVIKADISSFSKEELSTLILYSDIRLMIKAEDIPKVDIDDIVEIDGVEYKVKDTMPDIKKNIKLYSYIQVRK